MKSRYAIAALVNALLLLPTQNALSADVGFDDVASGTLVDSTYSSLGITLLSVSSQSGHAYASKWIASNTVTLWNPATFGSWASTFAAEEGAVKAVFSSPQKKVSIDALGVEATEFLGGDPLKRKPFLEAFDANNHLLATAYYPYSYGDGTNGWGTWQTLTIERPTADIAYVLFSSQANPAAERNRVYRGIWAAFDNLRTYPQTQSNYVGCYTDDGVRGLPVELMDSGATIESCTAAAKAQGYAYAGVQNGSQCFAGNMPSLSKAADSDCNMPCTADKSETCGGAWRNSIYATGVTPPAVPAPVYQGCYTDDANRALPVTIMSSSIATVETCVAAARARNLLFAGLQFNGQCYAGNAVGYTKVSDKECNTQCVANTAEICGGVWRSSVYSTGLALPPKPAATAYKGCFVDTPARTLPVALMSSGGTIESCVATAKKAGYKFAGVQAQGQCYAGNTLPSTKVADSDCNSPCLANKAEMCGGGWRNSVYSTQ